MVSPVAFALFDGQPEWTEVALVIGLGLALASIVSTAIARVVRTVLTTIYGAATAPSSRLITRPVFLARVVTFILAFGVTLVPLLELIGTRFDVGMDRRSLLHWAVASGFRVALIVTTAWLVLRIIATATARFEQELARGTDSHGDRLKRVQTLGGLVRNLAAALVIGVAALMILRELGVDIMPMLTGAGIAGVALGFGAQWLVRDLIAGFFVILEDQVRVGDSVVINGQGGSVEAINLRTMVLRDVEGAVHVFPNGAITTLANRSRDYAYYLVDLTVDFRQDTDKVVEILRTTAAGLQADPAYAPVILEPLEVMGVDSFRDGQVVVRSRLKTQAGRQFEVGRELRRRLRHALDQAGIDLPAPAMLPRRI
jgi:small-conductance mechanosensitive channel